MGNIGMRYWCRRMAPVYVHYSTHDVPRNDVQVCASQIPRYDVQVCASQNFLDNSILQDHHSNDFMAAVVHSGDKTEPFNIEGDLLDHYSHDASYCLYCGTSCRQ